MGLVLRPDFLLSCLTFVSLHLKKTVKELPHFNHKTFLRSLKQICFLENKDGSVFCQHSGNLLLFFLDI